MAGSAAGLAAGSVVGVTAGSAVGSAAGSAQRAPRWRGRRGSGDGGGGGGGGDGGGRHSAARSADVRRGRSSALHRHVRDELTSCFKSSLEMSPGARGASPSRARRRRQCTRTARAWRGSNEEGGGGLRHVHVHAHAHCDVWAGAAWADLLYSLLYIPLYRKLLYKAENRCIRRFTRTRVASRPSIAIQLYSAIQRCTLYSCIALYDTIHTSTTPLSASVLDIQSARNCPDPPRGTRTAPDRAAANCGVGGPKGQIGASPRSRAAGGGRAVKSVLIQTETRALATLYKLYRATFILTKANKP